ELIHAAAASGEVDVIGAFSTDARIHEFDLVVLEDDLGYFPPYEAVPVVRGSVLERLPELRPVLEELADRIDNATMMRLNHAVDVGKRPPREVVRDFLEPFLNEEETG